MPIQGYDGGHIRQVENVVPGQGGMLGQEENTADPPFSMLFLRTSP